MINEIERFIAVVDEGTFTKASKKLFLTQPALSLSVKRLEKEIGAKLFKQIGKRLVLTKDGESVYRIGHQILKLWRKVKDPKSRSSGEIISYSVGIFDNAALILSKHFQKTFSQNNYKFEITIDRSSNLIKGMQNGIYDVCICIINQEPSSITNCVLSKTFQEKLFPVSSKIWKKNISEIPFILYNQGSSTRSYIDKVFLENGIKPNVIVESTSPSFMKELAIGNCGVTLLPKNFIKREIQQKKLKIQKFPFTFERQIGLFLDKDSNLKESDEIIKDLIKNLKS